MPKNKYWTAVLYPENMIPSWKDDIGNLLQLPYAYCVHNADLTESEEQRKEHVHLIIVFPNTTTYKHAFSVFDKLSAPGSRALNTCEPVINIRFLYEYLIHNTEECRKKGKHQYSTSDRITGNNFDIGAFEQVSAAEKNDMCKELCNAIVKEGFSNFIDFYAFAISNFDSQYFEVIKTYSGLFDRLCKGNYHKSRVKKFENSKLYLEWLEKQVNENE